MATTYNDFLPDLGQLQQGDVILYGNKLNSQNPNIQSLFSQGSASPYKANGLDTIGLTVSKPYVKPTTTYTAEGTPVYRVTDNMGYDLPGNNAVSDREALLRTQEDALRQDYLSQTGDISNQYNSLRQTTLDAGNRNMGVLNRILGRAGGFTTTAGGTALVAKQGELDNQINQLNLAQQQALDKARVAYTKGNSDLLAQANSDIVAIKDKIAAAQAESAKNLVDFLKQQQEFGLKEQQFALEQAKFDYEKENPEIKTDITTMNINGKSHNVLINKITGEAIKDLGETTTTEKPITQEVGDTLLQYDSATGEWKTVYKGSTAQPGENEQLYSGLSSSTATAVRNKVSSFKTEQIITNFATIQEGYNFASAISNTTANPADDQALIYSLAKALDPGSVVREGEYATAQKYAQSWVNAYGKGVTQALLGTGFLSETARKNIKQTIKQKYEASKKSYDNLYNNYVKSINSLTGRSDGKNFLTDYAISGGKSKVDIINQYHSEFPNASPQELEDLFKEEYPDFNKVGGDTNEAVSKAVSVPDGSKQGQCGRFVNKYTGLSLGDTYQSKLAKMDSSITYPEPGMVFVMPYKDTGHTGFIQSVNNDGTVTVKDSNFGLDGTVKTHRLPIAKITGLKRV